MKTHALAHHHALAMVVPPRYGTRAVRFVMDRFLLVPIGAVIALIWANTAGESYFRFAHALAFPVNEVGMALFLALIAQEALEAAMPGGALHTWRHWTMPIVAGVGGVVGSALTYLGYVYLKDEHLLAQAWPIACSIDMAAGYYVLKMIYRRSSGCERAAAPENFPGSRGIFRTEQPRQSSGPVGSPEKQRRLQTAYPLP
jgi:hypothetical protein